jgi:hypothetical protein
MRSYFRTWLTQYTSYCVLIIICLTVCTQYNPLKDLKNGDFSLVSMGKYRSKTAILKDGGAFKDLVHALREEIEEHKDLLPLITRVHYDPDDSLVYKFKYAALDSISNSIVLRYFARIKNHPIIAGYQIQFIFHVHSRELLDIYTLEVDLE